MSKFEGLGYDDSRMLLEESLLTDARGYYDDEMMRSYEHELLDEVHLSNTAFPSKEAFQPFMETY